MTDSLPEGKLDFESNLIAFKSLLLEVLLLRLLFPPLLGLGWVTGQSSSSTEFFLLAKGVVAIGVLLPVLSLLSGKHISGGGGGKTPCPLSTGVKLPRPPSDWPRPPVLLDLVEEEVEVDKSECPYKDSSKYSSGQSRKKRTTLTGVTTSILNSLPPGLNRLGPNTVDRLFSDILF